MLLGGILFAAGFGALAGGFSNVTDVVQTRRLEIIDDNDRVVMPATAACMAADSTSGTPPSRHRPPHRERGRRRFLFDRGGRPVAGMYADGTAARIEVSNPENGSAAAVLTADERGAW